MSHMGQSSVQSAEAKWRQTEDRLIEELTETGLQTTGRSFLHQFPGTPES